MMSTKRLNSLKALKYSGLLLKYSGLLLAHTKRDMSTLLPKTP